MAIPSSILTSRTDAERIALIRAVYDWVIDHTDTIHEDFLGPDLAYLLGSIASGVVCEWPRDRPIVRLIRESRLAPVRAALDYIRVTEDPA